MSASEIAQPSSPSPEIRSVLRDLQSETILLVLPVLFIAAFALAASLGRFQNPAPVRWASLILSVLPIVVWGLRRLSYLASAWALVFGLIVVDLLVVAGGNFKPAICLLALPAGLAVLFVSLPEGVLAAIACTLVLLHTRATLLVPDSAMRFAALIMVWGTVGLMWLTLRPFMIVVQWSQTGYEESRKRLEQARDYQLKLKQTLEDLADANQQLTRLNRLAQAMRQAAEDARTAKEQFVANVSHELRTPLNMITGFSEMITQAPEVYGGDIPPALLADLDVILRNSQHLSKLIDDVLDLSQIEAGQMALTKERVALHEIVQTATIAVRPLFDSKGLSLETEVPDDLPPVFCDRTRVGQVVLNLLSNAGRYTERGGVHIRAWREDSDVVVSVMDTGAGIAAEDTDRIFQPFQQLDGSIRRRQGGSGLGLSISSSFVELHGGKMWLESEKGAGTTFFFRLPIDLPTPVDSGVSRWFSPHIQDPGRTRPSMAPVPTIRPRFVVVEAGNSMQRLLTRYLDGAEIVAAASLIEAIQELGRVPAQAVLINDISVSTSLQRLTESSALPSGTPVIICSIPGIQEAAGALGVSDYLVKPVSRNRLLNALDRLNLSGKTVLVVDDEPEALRLFRRMLVSSELGYRVLSASDGRQALSILREQRPNVVLLDLIMPNMDGFQLLAAKSQDPMLREIPVLVISARDPAGQPIVSKTLAVIRSDGFSVHRLLNCIGTISGILSTTGQVADLTLSEELYG